MFDSPTVLVLASEQSTSHTEPPEASTPVNPLKEVYKLTALPDSSENSNPSTLANVPGPSNVAPLIDWNFSALGDGTPHGGPLEPNDYSDNFQPPPPSALLGNSKTVVSHVIEPTLLLSPSSASSSSFPSSSSSSGQSSMASSSTGSSTSVILTSGQASLLGSLFSLAHPEDQAPRLIESGPANSPFGLSRGPTWPNRSFIEDVDPDDNDDPEGIRDIICKSPTPDPNTESNALPFVLQSYARWVNFVVFEPLKIAGMIREGVIMQFASSPEVRTRTCLIANVIGKLSKAPELDPKGMSIVMMLRSDAHNNINLFHSNGPASKREVDMQNALRVLDSIMEMVLIQRYSAPLSGVVGLMAAAAPVFRRACPDPPEKLVNLPNILATPGLNLQHFAATDVILSVTMGRPMFFKYDVECTPETFAQLVEGNYGLQWLHGVPDRFIIIMAWINGLREDHGDNVDPNSIAQIESQIQDVEIKPGSSPDPIFLILRLAVQECWRQTVYVYLYMVLCRAQADDPRVIRAVRAFVSIVNGLKPGRNPDSFLFIPIMMVGPFAYRERDRNLLRRRLIGLRECTNPSAACYECLEVLDDVWKRTQLEDRPAVWLDLRIAYYKITGV